jgi:hypothetical protein
MEAVKNPRIDAWLKGWNDGATARKARRPRTHADEYERGFQIGEEALLDAYAVAKTRILAIANRGDA